MAQKLSAIQYEAGEAESFEEGRGEHQYLVALQLDSATSQRRYESMCARTKNLDPLGFRFNGKRTEKTEFGW